MDDDGQRWCAECGQQEEHEAWLADPAAQREYQQYLDKLNSQDEKLWVGTRKTQAAETFNKHPQERTSQGVSD